LKRKQAIVFLLGIFTLSLVIAACQKKGQAAAHPSTPSSETIMRKVDLPASRPRAPEFPKEFAWVNSDRKLSLGEDLNGNVVLLDFWTYCCINCMHVLPDLEYLEQKYTGLPVVVVGVHSAKFDNESDARNIETACARYDIAHPVIVDEAHRIWSEYGVRAWPTLAVIDPEGRVVGMLSGEGNRAALDAIIYTLLEEGREKGTLAVAPPVIQRTGRISAASGLAFPGKVLAEPSGKFVFISDANHDRVIIADTSGEVLTIAGSGEKGQRDGSFRDAQFDNPQGLAYDSENNLLYVADTDNHLIRRLDLTRGTVETIAGTGEQVYDRNGGRAGTRQGLNSPWDLALAGDTLYVAMAGMHQLWILDVKSLVARAWIGSGHEDIRDDDGDRAALAQPSGLAIRGDWLYFADSEVSAVRKANLRTREVQTLVGSGLFDFGDRDGRLARALLQHPLGVAVHIEDVLVADTYNHKIKRVREADGSVTTITDGLPLYEPGGISVRGETLYIADTNHDRIIEFDLTSGEWHEFTLRGLREIENVSVADSVPIRDVFKRQGGELRLELLAEFTDGIHLNAEAPIHYSLRAAGTPLASAIRGTVSPPKLPVSLIVPPEKIANGNFYDVQLDIAYCTTSDKSVCVPVTLRWRLRISETAQADGIVRLAQRVNPIMQSSEKPLILPR